MFFDLGCLYLTFFFTSLPPPCFSSLFACLITFFDVVELSVEDLRTVFLLTLYPTQSPPFYSVSDSFTATKIKITIFKDV
eukprot:m.134308 g.134308  ORF g.134308 m.134308 type:complete len:80 (-) comp9547_c0_seq1:848-1087(-)